MRKSRNVVRHPCNKDPKTGPHFSELPTYLASPSSHLIREAPSRKREKADQLLKLEPEIHTAQLKHQIRQIRVDQSTGAARATHVAGLPALCQWMVDAMVKVEGF